MRLRRLWLTDFRGYPSADVTLDDGLTVVVGPNGHGKTNLLEAVGYLATLASFRGAPTDALIRVGADRAVVRGEAEREGRALLLEAELVAGGRNRAQINRQPLRRARDLLGALQVSVFAPDDLALVKGGPAERRTYLDDALVALHPRHDQLRSDLDKILRQRTALLKQAGGRLTPEIELTLDVFDAKLARVGDELAAARRGLVDRLLPVLGRAYDRVARAQAEVTAVYDPPWAADGLAAALVAARRDDLRRAVTTIGPHRDDLDLAIGGLPARTHASQGEQRSLALALRLSVHEVVSEHTGTPPVMLLDDVFSELDPDRSDALLHSLPAGQTLLSTAGALPAGAVPGRVLRVHEGTVRAD
ncbi:MAG: replication and repair protein RecF [Acidimicrobiales bacterium]|nr:replication and repair protein RecF [Acidimicrobiales bacterium]